MNPRGDGFDVVVQGAGAVGLACATALAQAGVRVAVLDRELPGAWQDGPLGARVVAINRRSEAFLAQLGVWRSILDARAAPVRAIEARDAAGGGRVGFAAADLGEAHVAHVVEDALIRAMLAQAAQRAGVHLRAPAAVEEWQGDGPDGLRLRLDSGAVLRSRLLVGADGADSAIRINAGITTTERDYGQAAVVTAVTTTLPHGGVARQRFLAGGPLAFLPLPDGRCSIVWSLPASEAEAVCNTADEAFLELLTTAFDGWLGTVTAASPRVRFALRRLNARHYTGERLALIGDAAHVVHPLAGQGANLGLADAAALADEVGAAAGRGRQPGGQAVLRRYERRRRGENELIQRSMDAFHHAFTRGEPWLVAARSLGFDVTDRTPALRRLFMRVATGG